MRTDTLPSDVNPSDKAGQPSAKPKVLTLAQRRLAPVAIEVAPPETPQVRFLRRTLIALVIVLVFEGLVRKLQPGAVGTLVFFFKDFIILFMGIQIATRHKLPAAINFLSIGYLLLFVLMLPNILSTAGNDAVLAVFGAKQYLLYPVVALSVFVVFRDAPTSRIIEFCRLVAFLMIPTGVLAMAQTQLPATSWVNMSVDGESLEDFSAAGHLRVSSTFSFVAQFCCFLNMEMFMIFLALYGFGKMSSFKKLIFASTIPMLVISCYLTGSRGAVIGNGSVLIIAVALSLLRFEFGKVMRLASIAVVLVGVVFAFQALFPTLMATYTVREGSTGALGVSDEVKERVWNAYFGWTADVDQVPFLGNGIGIMSNGADVISHYARGFRIATWTETDFATTLFEGGPYLMLVWYGFRFYMILQTTLRFLLQTSKELFAPGAFCQGFVILFGLTGTLGIQPPIAIWWHLAIGMSVVFWWRSLHPLSDGTPEKIAAKPKYGEAGWEREKPKTKAKPVAPQVVAPGTGPKVRGRSAMADRLHGREK